MHPGLGLLRGHLGPVGARRQRRQVGIGGQTSLRQRAPRVGQTRRRTACRKRCVFGFGFQGDQIAHLAQAGVKRIFQRVQARWQ